ncbi:DinB family protein [Antribacter sp. KLBMP9083]|uniref:DinB family protein n=1 Tax=Antribacter soli TaxID=2910976 RepID=A0AA41U7Z3_9MICO|nr:DinB family protein [Antribacter soli]MCF4122488.1 DinB family protein [Antribacter soli]
MTTAESRVDPPIAADELSTLTGFLDYQRDTLRWKCSGLSREELARSLAPSTLTLGGLLKHLTVVEAGWLNLSFAGGFARPSWLEQVAWDDPDWSFKSAAADDPEDLFAWLAETQEHSAQIIAAAADGLDTLSADAGDDGRRWSLRSVLCHMIGEYARHNGHADLIRQSIDGATGD